MPPSAATRIVVLSRPTGRYRSPPGAVNATWVSSGATTRGTQRPGSGISVPTSPVRVSTRRRIVPSPVVQTAVPDGVGNPAPSTRVADPRSRARPAFVSTSTASGTAGPAGTRRAHPANTATPPATVRNVRRVVSPGRHRGTWAGRAGRGRCRRGAGPAGGRGGGRGAAGCAARRRPRARYPRPRRGELPLLPGPHRGGDGADPRLEAGHGQVPHVAGPHQAARTARPGAGERGGAWLTHGTSGSSPSYGGWARGCPYPPLPTRGRRAGGGW